MKVTVLEIIRGSKSNKVLSVQIKYLEDASYNYMKGYEYERQVCGKQIKSEMIDKKEYKKYHELSKDLEVVYLGNYRQRIYTQYILETEENV